MRLQCSLHVLTNLTSVEHYMCTAAWGGLQWRLAAKGLQFATSADKPAGSLPLGPHC